MYHSRGSGGRENFTEVRSQSVSPQCRMQSAAPAFSACEMSLEMRFEMSLRFISFQGFCDMEPFRTFVMARGPSGGREI